jgi:PAS domain S-box-containing protein
MTGQQLDRAEFAAPLPGELDAVPELSLLYRSTFEQLPIGIAYTARDGRFIWTNHAFNAMVQLTAQELAGKSIQMLTHAEDFGSNDREIARLWAGEISSYTLQKRYVRKDAAAVWVRVTAALVRDPAGRAICAVGFLEDISELRQREAEVERIHKQLMEASRHAGMAEVATNVLHNVGNVLNSVNVSASLVIDRLKHSKLDGLAKIANLLRDHSGDMAGFMSQDERGRQLPKYLAALSEHIHSEQLAVLEELESLRKHIDHIKDTVAMQQSYARRCGLTETVDMHSLVEDSLSMNTGALTRHHVALRREFAPVPPITVDKHMVLQILVNLVRNAKYACDETGRPDKEVCVRIESLEGKVRISVIDNGVGIKPEHRDRLFSHGFTTRQAGHGFGLHSAALAAAELGGTLSAHSDGAGCGATFSLELPLSPPNAVAK